MDREALAGNDVSSPTADRQVYDAAPNPGSDVALKQGCKCPVLDNAHGRGYMGRPGIFVYTENCPVHAATITALLAQENVK